jgi:hypothetical protein
MPQPKAYCPQYGYRFQILVKCPDDRTFEHCDYATTGKEKHRLLAEYRLAYGPGFEFKSVLLPMKYWPKKVATQ